MKRRLIVLVSMGMASACALVGACSGTDQSIIDSGADATADTSSSTDTGTQTDTSPANDSGTGEAGVDAPSPDEACLTDDGGCVNCCFNNHADGATTYFSALLTCACSTGTTCHSATICLNNLCKGGAPSTACDKCLQNPDAGDCDNKANTACAGDPDCVALGDCISGVCAPPPTDAGGD